VSVPPRVDTPPAALMADAVADIDLSAPERVADGYLLYERYKVHLRHADGSSDRLNRDVIRVGRVAGVLCVDPARAAVVLIRQFRLAAHLATGRGELVEIVAGRVEAGEESHVAALRECQEEVGVTPSRLVHLFQFMPSPGITDEMCDLYLGIVDSRAVPERGGLASETEVTLPVCIPIAEALTLLEPGRSTNAYLLLALQWLALNPDTLARLAAED